jgi:hypothetical protein
MLLCVCWLNFLTTPCSANNGPQPQDIDVASGTIEYSIHSCALKDTTMKIIIGSKTFTASLYDNATANALKAMLPLTINMSELNGNEKFYYLSGALPTNASPRGNIQPGDLMLYGNNCLVLFYKGFSTSYSYTKVGRVNDWPQLAAAVGSGNIKLTLEL